MPLCLTVAAIPVIVATGSDATSTGSVSLTNGQSATISCSDGSPLEINGKTGSTATAWCFDPYAPPYTTTTTTAPPTTTTTSTTTTTAPPTTTTSTTSPPSTTTTMTTTPTSGWACTASVPTNDPSQGAWVYWENDVCPFGAAPTNFVGNDGSAPEVDDNVWNPICTDSSGNVVDVNASNCVTRQTQTVQANSPQDYQVVANVPVNPTGSVTAYPNVWAHGYNGAVDSYTRFTSSFSESFPHNGQTTGWAMYDLWFNGWANEVMIQVDFNNNPDCDSSTQVANNVTFGGSNGVPVQQWHLCDFGSGVVAWKLGATEGAGKQSEHSGSVDILAMLNWLEAHSYLPANSTWTAVSEGWEIVSTGGQNETFTVWVLSHRGVMIG